ncbi:hypothetical protein PR048_012898 [Dryococelus australis]|uniref:Uncharacterized protein n=1 Tax=Dryococelus australis TaxID=614101 RepID=A0ABQ9HRI0_9NEOP|nr:hypothetical protein PR048_012898 [Dryococelus australis]
MFLDQIPVVPVACYANNIYCNVQEELAGVDPRVARHYRPGFPSRSSSQDRDSDVRKHAYRPPRHRNPHLHDFNGGGHNEGDDSHDSSDDGLEFDRPSHGIIELSAEKAGRDVTPLNLGFGEDEKNKKMNRGNFVSGKSTHGFHLEQKLKYFIKHVKPIEEHILTIIWNYP